MKAIAESTGREMKKIKGDYAEIGDLGIIAMVRDWWTLSTTRLSLPEDGLIHMGRFV